MADFDLGAIVGSLAQNVGSYFIQQQQMKNAMKAGRAILPSRLPSMGMGYSAGPLVPYAATTVLPANPPGVTPLGQVGQMLGFSDETTGANPCALFHRPRVGPAARADQLVMQVNPDTGKMHFWRHVGHPILYSGDVSHCRTVAKILGRAGRKMHRGSRRPR